MDSNIIVFLDFDGTLIEKDSLDVLFEKFISKDVVDHYETQLGNDNIGARECLESLFEKIKSLEKDQFLSIADNMTLTRHAAEFIKYLNIINGNIYIISDGVNLIIERILKNISLDNYIEGIFCNRLEPQDGQMLFRPYSEICDHKPMCALCKSAVVKKLISENSKSMSIYIGDGKSDIFPAKECDLVFAKKTLLESPMIPEDKKIPFDDFSTILEYFRKNII